MSEKRYRDLEYGELIETGDEIFVGGEWFESDSCVGLKHSPDQVRVRRPIAEPTDTIVGPQRNMTGEKSEAIDNFTWSELENGGEVGTPRKPKISDEEARRRLKLIPCMVEITDAYSESNDTLAAPDITPILSKHFQAVEKERDEWREIAGKLAKLLDENCYGYEQYEVDVTSCNYCGSSKEHCDSCEIKLVLAAYELKAKEGV